MKTTLKALSLALAATFGAAALCLLAFISPRSPALKNQRAIIFLPYRARPKLAPGGTDEIRSVARADRISLPPGRTQVAFGYKLTLTVAPSGFTITADPQAVGKTGACSFFRDLHGEVRFEPELGKPATERSRVFGR
jgi:hypothetical protein